MNPCIVYLAQNTAKDVHYGRDSRTMLERSLRLLYKNYNNKWKYPVLIFHEGDFDALAQEEVRDGRDEIEFHQVIFKIPDFLNPAEIPTLWDGHIPMGVRHMCRFYSLQIFDILNDLGYDWFFRLDDDSFIHTEISYDLFEYMETHGHEYGYRVDIKDPQRVCYGFSDAVLAYLKAERITPETFLDHFKPSREINNEHFSITGRLKNVVGNFIDRLSTKINYDLNAWPPTSEWDRWGYYNNFFITKIDFWLRPDVQSFLHHFDRIGCAYKYRWSDLIIQTAAVQIFLAADKVYKFTDWTYEHATIRHEKLNWGGIYQGIDDSEGIAIDHFKRKYGKVKIADSF
jgi:Mannosyltransferase